MSVSDIPIYVPIVMYGLRLFIVVLQELHFYYNVFSDYCGVFNETYVYSFVLIGHYVRELHSHLCPYCNVWPGAVVTRTTLFTELLTCWFHYEL